MVNMYAEDVVCFGFQFVLPLHGLDMQMDAHHRAVWTYLMKEGGGNDHESCTAIFVGVGHVHGHRGDHLHRFA